MTLLIMAAGMGSRYGGIKQIEPIGTNGELIIDYSIYDAVRAGFTKVVFVIRRDIEKDFCDRIFDRIKEQSGIEAEYVFQDKDDLPKGFKMPADRVKPWGTTHAVLAARKVVNDPFCIINADDFYGAEAFTKMAKFLETLKVGSTCTSMVGYKLAKTLSAQGTVSRGVCEVKKHLAKDMVTVINERLKIERRGGKMGYIDGDDFYHIDENADTAVNFFGFGPSIMPMLEEKFTKFLSANINNLKAELQVPIALNELLKEGKITMEMMTSKDNWLGFTYPEDKVAVQNEIKALVKSGAYPAPLWKD